MSATERIIAAAQQQHGDFTVRDLGLDPADHAAATSGMRVFRALGLIEQTHPGHGTKAATWKLTEAGTRWQPVAADAPFDVMLAAGYSHADVARRFGVKRSRVRDWQDPVKANARKREQQRRAAARKLAERTLVECDCCHLPITGKLPRTNQGERICDDCRHAVAYVAPDAPERAPAGGRCSCGAHLSAYRNRDDDSPTGWAESCAPCQRREDDAAHDRHLALSLTRAAVAA